MTQAPTGEVTQLLENWKAGRSEALDELLPLIYGELRTLASRYLRKERMGHTLQATALVHEAFLRLVVQDRARVQNRSHFFAVASQAMRRILVDHARRQHAGKRIGAHNQITLADVAGLAKTPNIDIMALHEALENLSEINPQQAKLVELRYFGGLTNTEAAEVLEVSLATVERYWKVARLWLHRRLKQNS